MISWLSIHLIFLKGQYHREIIIFKKDIIILYSGSLSVLHTLSHTLYSSVVPRWVFITIYVRNVFGACRSIMRACGRGLGPENQVFWGLKWQREKRLPLGPKKVLEIVPKRIFFSVHFTCQSQLSEQYSGSQLAFGTIFWVLGSYCIWKPEQPSKKVSERIFQT